MRITLVAVSMLSLTGPALAAPSCPATIAPAAAIVAAPVVAKPAAPADLPSPLSAAEIAGSPALQRIASRRAQLFALPEQHGLRAVFARSGNEFRVFYVTPDGQAEIGGVMWDAAGHNVTRDQVAGIPGVIPTVRLTAATAHERSADDSQAVIHPEAQLAAAHFGLEGFKEAPRVYMVMDPLCPYSIKAYGDLAPYVASGALQLALVPISINDHENDGESTTAALEMLSAPQDDMGKAWSRIIALGHAEPGVEPSDTAPASLTLNLAAAHAIQLQGTPTFVWRDGQGVHEEAGAPDDLAPFVQSLRP
jgi:thiol:disulfide interchange protein DsbG